MPDVLVDAAVAMLVVDLATLVAVYDGELLIARALQNHGRLLVGEVLPERVEVEIVDFGDGLELRERPHIARFAEGGDGALVDGLRRVGDDQLRINFLLDAQAVALRACPIRRVEGEYVGGWILVREAVFRGGEVAGENVVANLGRMTYGRIIIRPFAAAGNLQHMRDDRSAAHP